MGNIFDGILLTSQSYNIANTQHKKFIQYFFNTYT